MESETTLPVSEYFSLTTQEEEDERENTGPFSFSPSLGDEDEKFPKSVLFIIGNEFCER